MQHSETLKRDETRKLEVTYCEDVRLEMTGQTSVIGIFHGQMISPVFPCTLPKFAISVEIGSPIDEQMVSLTLEVWTDDGATLVKQEFPSELLMQQKAAVNQLDLEGFDEKFVGFRTQFFVAPLVLEKPTMIRSRIITEKGVVRGRALKVSQGNASFPTLQGVSS